MSDPADDITRQLLSQRGSRDTTSAEGERWILTSCLWHEDRHRSASWQPETGVFYCAACDRTWRSKEVAERLGVASRNGHHSNGHGPALGLNPKSRRRPGDPPTPVVETVWTYVFPDGSPSHQKVRQDPGKQFYQRGVLTQKLPAQTWPLYGDHALPQDAFVVVVEGERHVDTVTALRLTFEGRPVHALTGGSSSETRRAAPALAVRLRALEPHGVLVWPDHDDPGRKAMDAVASELKAQGIPFKRLDPAAYGLPAAGDVVDFLAAGGDLAQVLRDHFTSASNLQVDRLIESTLVTSEEQMVLNRHPRPIQPQYIQALWQQEYGSLPSARQVEQTRARLLLKAGISPIRVSYRAHADNDCAWWRPSSRELCWRISEGGLERAQDPPERLLLVPPGEQPYGGEVDLQGTSGDLAVVMDLFGIEETDRAMIQGWLVSALAGLQVPILYLKAGAGVGKTTLARFLLSVVEPICPAIEASRSRSMDVRALELTLKLAAGVLLDNVSQLDGAVEDLLSQLVTGYSASHRPLYSNEVEFLALRRALILTSVSYDPGKGDLVSRMVVAEPRLSGWLAEEEVLDQLQALMPRVRGWVFRSAVEYFRRRGQHARTQPFRVASMGRVLAVLGHDVDAMARQEAQRRMALVGSNDAWLDSIMDLWHQEREDGNVMVEKSTSEIVTWMRSWGISENMLPAASSPRFAAWFDAKQQMFTDRGFKVERVRRSHFRGYRFEELD